MFYETGSKRGIPPAHAVRLTAILAVLDAAAAPEGTMLASYRTHALQGDRKGFYSMWVSGNWRITFRFIDTTWMGMQSNYDLSRIRNAKQPKVTKMYVTAEQAA